MLNTDTAYAHMDSVTLEEVARIVGLAYADLDAVTHTVLMETFGKGKTQDLVQQVYGACVPRSPQSGHLEATMPVAGQCFVGCWLVG